MSSLDRLIRLAQRTGDRLIVHDRRGEDVVIMSVDEYEDLLDEVVAGGFEHTAYEETSPWHSAEDVLEERYHDTVPHAHQEHGRHDRQYHEGDWEEARHAHEVQQPRPVAQPQQPATPPPPPPQPIQYHEQEGVEVEQHREEQLEEPVFYEEPV